MAKKTDYTALTEQVCDLLGGKSNIGYFTHCVTRLRFSIKDKGLVKEDELRSMEGVADYYRFRRRRGVYGYL